MNGKTGQDRRSDMETPDPQDEAQPHDLDSGHDSAKAERMAAAEMRKVRRARRELAAMCSGRRRICDLP